MQRIGNDPNQREGDAAFRAEPEGNAGMGASAGAAKGSRKAAWSPSGLITDWDFTHTGS